MGNMSLKGRVTGLIAGLVFVMLAALGTCWYSLEKGTGGGPAAFMICGLLALAVALGIALFASINTALKGLGNLAEEMEAGASEVAVATAQVSKASQTLAQGSSDQASAIEETSATTEEITSMTRKNAANSQSAAALMHHVDQEVMVANKALAEMVLSMREITSSSAKIDRIIKVIDEIAFQTNILALNAAVEAARAGEAGMGFAVVADEVRNLAQRSAQAAKDTAALIEESIQKSSEGSVKLEEVTGSIRAITESTSKAKTLIDDVNRGSQEQAKGIERISKAICQMEQVTQRNAASAVEGASASHELNSQATALSVAVERLHSIVSSEKGTHLALAATASRTAPRILPAPTMRSITNSSRSRAGLKSPPKTDPFPMEDEDFVDF